MIPKKILSRFDKQRRGRFVLLFFLCVLLPTIPLAYLVVRTIREVPESISKKIEGRLQEVAPLLAERVTATLINCEDTLDDSLSEFTSLNETVDKVGGSVNACPAFDSFFILDSNLQPLFPFDKRPDEVLEIGSAGKESDKFAGEMAKGFREEFGSGNPEGAIKDYKQALAHAGGNQYGAIAENAIARCHFKAGRYDDAKKHYGNILKKVGTGVFYDGISLKLLALYRLAVIDRIMKDDNRAAERFLDIMATLANGWMAGSVYEAILYVSKAEKEIKEMLSSKELAQQYQQRLDKVVRQWRHTKSAALGMKELREKAQFDFQKLLRERKKVTRSFMSISKIIDGKESILLCRLLWGREHEGPVIIAVVLDAAALRKEIGNVLSEAVKSEGDINAAVYDSSGSTIAGGCDRSSSSGYEAPMNLGPSLPFWELNVVYRKDGGLFIVPKRGRTTRLASIFFLLAVTLLGLYVTYRSIKRDTELARLKSYFVSRVSHELRTPLATIRAVGEMLEMGAVSSREKEKEYFSLIASESERLSRLIDNVLDFSKIDSAKKRYRFRTADLKKTVSNTVRVFRQYVRPQGFNIVFDLDEDVPMMVVDEDAISQALINLMDNAVKFSRDEKEVKVELRRMGAKIKISVRDNGIGIAPEDLDRIFDQFYRPKETTELSGKGAGIGLAIVKHVAEAHGGKVEVQSKQGEGSLFTLLLPIQRHSET